MALFIWKDSYSVGIHIIDEQHKKLVSILNDLHSAMLSGQGKAKLAETIKELVDYTKYHFKEEELLMKQHGYTAYEPHKQVHDTFIEKIAEFQNEQQSGNALVSVDIMNFLKEWLQDHINGMDKKYAPFFHSKGVS